MAMLHPVERVRDLRLGTDPVFDAWFYSFCAENNIEHNINPRGVASPEQMRFMVAMDDTQVYVPCSDYTFQELVESSRARMFSPYLLREYVSAWVDIIRLLRRIPDREKRRNLINYCRYRFRGSYALGNILPSRLMKRLIMTVLTHGGDRDGINDPWAEERMRQNQDVSAFLDSDFLRHCLGALPEDVVEYSTIESLRRRLDLMELSRLFHLAGRRYRNLAQIMETVRSGERLTYDLFAGVEAFVPQVEHVLGSCDEPRLFLYLCDAEGGLALDLRIIKTLLRLGHKVVLSLKDTPLFHAPTLWDVEHDRQLVDSIRRTSVLRDTAVSKNTLLKRLRECRLLMISDGTGERLNLYRVSTTFARAWKECDIILAKGRRNKEVLLDTSHRFTRDVFCFWEEDGNVRMKLRPRDPDVRKFSEQALAEKAKGIIARMRHARDSGKSVMFYSCIIGSLPGQTKIAVQVAETFVEYLRQRMEDMFIVNPVEYFEHGMDGDDLMFMWEQVQRSGLITVWRFQSIEDIEASFAMMNRKVPPLWSGKDATYSTGCTKEMQIALDMQRSHPELQIIGPSPDRFFRRQEYGIGKFFDATLSPQEFA